MPAANEGKILVVVDVTELAHKPMSTRSPAADPNTVFAVRAGLARFALLLAIVIVLLVIIGR
jgi:hypothetical protein